MAERQGFEPWVPEKTHLISSQAHSTNSGTSPRGPNSESENRIRDMSVNVRGDFSGSRHAHVFKYVLKSISDLLIGTCKDAIQKLVKT